MTMLLNGLRGLAVACLCLSCSASAVNTVPVSLATRTAADGVEWLEWATAYEKVNSEKKIMVIDLYTDWCYWCKVMDKETYGKSKVQKALADNFVAVKLNPETKGKKYTYEGKEYTGSELANVLSKGQIQGYPTTLFLTPKGKVFVHAGYIKENDFLDLLKDVSAKASVGQ